MIEIEVRKLTFLLDIFTLFFKYVPLILFYGIIIVMVLLYLRDKFQAQHSILKTHPVLGRMRYIFEMIGPEMRQYWFLNDREAKPIDRNTQETIAIAGKYANTVIGFGSKKDFAITDFYLNNSMFPLNTEELSVDQSATMRSYTYQLLNETLISRKEKRDLVTLKPWHLTDKNAVIIGPEREQPFHVKGMLGVSAMSYGALSASAVQALTQGVAISGGSFMNTGEGGLSSHHLSRVYEVKDTDMPSFDHLSKKIVHFIAEYPNSSNFELEHYFGRMAPSHADQLVEQGILEVKTADLIFQISSGLFGARKNDKYDEATFLINANRPEVKAIEMKLAQGAKVRGGKLPKEKITEEIAEVRGVGMDKDIESPNRFPLFHDMKGMFDWITHFQDITGKPIGIKVVAGDKDSFEELARYMQETGKHPDFISIDGAEGGTGATYQEMADRLGLPVFSGLYILDQTLRKYGVRDKVKIIASGMLATADKMAIALSLGADLIYIARAAMNTVGCINAAKCHTNLCPVGVTSHLPHLESGLVVEEKRFRTANYLRTMREGLFMLGASCGIDSPTKFEEQHVTLREANNGVKNMETTFPLNPVASEVKSKEEKQKELIS